MDDYLTVSHRATHDGQPLAVVRNLPGPDAELRPAQLRGLARALLCAAADCEALTPRPGPNKAQREYYTGHGAL